MTPDDYRKLLKAKELWRKLAKKPKNDSRKLRFSTLVRAISKADRVAASDVPHQAMVLAGRATPAEIVTTYQMAGMARPTFCPGYTCCKTEYFDADYAGYAEIRY